MNPKDIKFNYYENDNKKISNKKSKKETFTNTSSLVPKKIKHFDFNKRESETLTSLNQKSMRVEDESFLLLPQVNSRQKTKVELKDDMHPHNYNVDLKSNNIRKTKNYTSYYGDHYGPGKGFGNFDTNNSIRNGKSTRLDNETFYKKQESTINDRRDIIFKNYQNPKNLILPFPRGGEITRKTTNRNQDIRKEDFTEFEFKY